MARYNLPQLHKNINSMTGTITNQHKSHEVWVRSSRCLLIEGAGRSKNRTLWHNHDTCSEERDDSLSLGEGLGSYDSMCRDVFKGLGANQAFVWGTA